MLSTKFSLPFSVSQSPGQVPRAIGYAPFPKQAPTTDTVSIRFGSGRGQGIKRESSEAAAETSRKHKRVNTKSTQPKIEIYSSPDGPLQQAFRNNIKGPSKQILGEILTCPGEKGFVLLQNANQDTFKKNKFTLESPHPTPEGEKGFILPNGINKTGPVPSRLKIFVDSLK